jgi:SpoVK/Ycf46/Vps4 family AAA+-type ATPase
MTSAILETVQTANYQYLMSAIEQLKTDFLINPTSTTKAATNSSAKVLNEQSAAMHLEQLCLVFKLSHFERQILLMCIGFELLPGFARDCLTLGKEKIIDYPTLEMALALFPTGDNTPFNQHWPVYYWQLLERSEGDSLLTQTLRISHSILHYLQGYSAHDSRLTSLLFPVDLMHQPLAFYENSVKQIIDAWQQQSSPMIFLAGNDIESQRQIIIQACSQQQFPLYYIDPYALPVNVNEWQILLRLLVRETWLHYNRVYLVECDNLSTDKLRALAQLIQAIPANCILTGTSIPPEIYYPCLTIKVPTPTAQQQHQIWEQVLTEEHHPESFALAELSTQFNLSASQIHQIFREWQTTTVAEQSSSHRDSLWQYCRHTLRRHATALVQVIEPQADWQDLSLPPPLMDLLHIIVMQVKHRAKVYQEWGFSTKNQRGLGISALFAGPSGTGKTLAAEVIANTLQLDIHYIDLSNVVSKYIGETEKHLKQIFNQAEASGAILLFDEADSLFGKRHEVKDSHDHYVNLQINYLLQQIEAYRGLSILTTNLKESLDEAFLRRIRFIVPFPFPDYQQRLGIWQRIFPTQTPTQGLNYQKLARLNLAGGHLRNIALNAAFFAADQQQPVMMTHLLKAAQEEYFKLERVLTEAEVKDWV